MHKPNPRAPQSLEDLITEIGALKTSLDSLIAEFRAAVTRLEVDGMPTARRSGQFWVAAAFTNALVRLRLFVEHNFDYLETLGVLAVTRYVFELTVWLRLLHKNPSCGRVYYRELVTQQMKHYEDLRNHLLREIAFLRSVDKQEKELLTE
jgi:hypothetical protein